MKDVHTRHCCKLHGCKYGQDETCSVVKGFGKQEYLCESCGFEGFETMDDLNRRLDSVTLSIESSESQFLIDLIDFLNKYPIKDKNSTVVRVIN